ATRAGLSCPVVTTTSAAGDAPASDDPTRHGAPLLDDSDLPRLLVRTVEIPHEADLLTLLPFADASQSFSWVRRGDGVVGWGSALRFDSHGPERFQAADEAWTRAVARFDIDDQVGMPGTGPVAFGSFSFDPRSPAGGV